MESQSIIFSSFISCKAKQKKDKKKRKKKINKKEKKKKRKYKIKIYLENLKKVKVFKAYYFLILTIKNIN